jgi:phage terminase large subunit
VEAEPLFDWKNPDYIPVFQRRARALGQIRTDPSILPALKCFYRNNPGQFITDWGCTADPRHVEVGLPVVIPFLLFKRQQEWIDWVIDSWRNRRPGVTPKSRESGLSWLAIALACTLCLFNDDMAIGFGSRLQDYVDKIGAPKSLFWKARKFLELLPAEFASGFDPKNDAPHMRIIFRKTGSVISGDCGDNIGRGDRASIYFVDEAAFLEHPETVDAALSQTTNCRIDISTANGMGNPFFRKVTEWPSPRVFRIHWRDDPRKDEAWYAKQVADLSNPVVIASEIDIDFSASVEGVLIPSAWVQAAIDAHVRLGFTPTGARVGALDVADEGKDTNAFCGAHGVLVETLEEWSGKGDDIFGTTQRAFGICDRGDYLAFKYDADGLGAAVRGDARILNEGRTRQLTVEAFRGSAGVFNPEGQDVKGRKNQDMFANCKAQAWWALRTRFETTYRAVVKDVPADPDQIISIRSDLPHRARLCSELSQPTYTVNAVGKIVVDKTPDGTRSPNLADAMMIRFSTATRPPMRISAAFLANAARR